MRNLLALLVLAACSAAPDVPTTGKILSGDASFDSSIAGTPDALPPDTANLADVGAPGDGAADTAPDAAAAAPLAVLTLDPKTLTFFGLPINSIRFAVAGLDPIAHACVSLIFDYSNTGAYYGSHCDDFHGGFPYVIVDMNTDGPCQAWTYGGPGAVKSAKGCVDFAMLGHADRDLGDLEVQVDTPSFTGLVRVDNRTATTPNPISFVLNYVSDVPENVYVQQFGEHGAPDWVRIRKDGKPVVAFDRCDTPTCDSPGTICASVEHRIVNFTQNANKGNVALTWDGRLRTLDTAKGCMVATPAPAGNYTATFCFGSQVMATGSVGDVVSPTCFDKPFTLPQKAVVYTVNAGG